MELAHSGLVHGLLHLASPKKCPSFSLEETPSIGNKVSVSTLFIIGCKCNELGRASQIASAKLAAAYAADFPFYEIVHGVCCALCCCSTLLHFGC